MHRAQTSFASSSDLLGIGKSWTFMEALSGDLDLSLRQKA